MNRRGFLGVILAAAAAPAIVRASSLAPLVIRRPRVGNPLYDCARERFQAGELLSAAYINVLVAHMRQRHIPPTVDGDYIFIMLPSTRGLA